MKLTVKLKPRASKDEIIGFKDGILWIRVTAPPVDNQANEAVIKLLAKHFSIRKSGIRIVAGNQSRIKIIEFDVITEPEIYAKLKGK